MATAAEVQVAYKAINRTDLNITVAQATADAINAGTTTLDAYIASQLAATVSTTQAGVAIAAFVTGTVPTSAKLDALKVAADAQVASYAAMGVGNPALGAFEAFGKGFALTSEFDAKYGALNGADFINAVYTSVFGAPPSAGAFANLDGQIKYFTTLYKNAGLQNAEAQAKGAVLGQIVGYAFVTSASSNSVLDNQVATFLTAAAHGDVAGYGAPLPAFSVVHTLTEGTDILTGNVFNAPRGFTPGGTDQVNTLNDDDVLTGSGVNPTLNFTFVNDADTGIRDIAPRMIGVETVNVDVRIHGYATLDLQDSTGVLHANITGIDDGDTFTLDNVTTAGGLKTLAIKDSHAPDGNVVVTHLGTALAGAADSLDLTLNNAQLDYLVIEERGGSPKEGYETINLKSTGAANAVNVLQAEDLKTLAISGDQNLKLGKDSLTNNAERIDHQAGLNHVAGSLDTIDASALNASLDINLGSEVTADVDGKSGVPVEFKLIGTAKDDTIRLINGFDSKGDSIDGGGGNDTLMVFSSVAKGSVSNVERLDVRSVSGAVTVDASLFKGLNEIWIRDEGGNSPTTLNKLTADQANHISIQHGISGSNWLGANTVVVNLATQTASDSATVDWTDHLADGEDRNVNTDPRFNQTLKLDKIESLTLVDNDSESNTFDIQGGSALSELSNSLTLKGGKAGQFLNLDATANMYQYDKLGGEADGKFIVDAGGGPAERFSAATIDATAYVGDVVVRVGTLRDSAGNALPGGGQKILMGSGNDTVIFDNLADTTAGLSISDTVKGGEGNDVLAIDGDGVKINLSASEWTNVSGFETIRLIDNDVIGPVFNKATALGAGDAYGRNAYNLTLTNDLIANNGEAVTGGRIIHIVNDIDPANDKYGTADSGVFDTVSGATIDARSLNAQSNFSYNGEEGAFQTADRFIMSDANINGMAQIDGGAILGVGNGPSNLANLDVLEVRNAAVVTVGDLAGIKNVGTIEFTNDTATSQASVLQLDNNTVEALVNSSHTAKAGEVETLNVAAYDNPLVAGAHTVLNLDASQVTSAFLSLNITSGGGQDQLTLGGGSDTVNYLKAANAGGDTIKSFNAGTAATTVDVLSFKATDFGAVAGQNIGNGNAVIDIFASGNDAAINVANTEIAVKTDATVANNAAAVQAKIDAYANITTGAVFVFSDGTNAHVWYDADPSAAGGAVEIATLQGVSLAGLANFNVSDFQLFV